MGIAIWTWIVSLTYRFEQTVMTISETDSKVLAKDSDASPSALKAVSTWLSMMIKAQWRPLASDKKKETQRISWLASTHEKTIWFHACSCVAIRLTLQIIVHVTCEQHYLVKQQPFQTGEKNKCQGCLDTRLKSWDSKNYMMPLVEDFMTEF